VEYRYIYNPEARRLLASDYENPYRVSVTPGCGHRTVERVRSMVEVRHAHRDQWMIWLAAGGVLFVHGELLAEFEKKRISGYRTRPATVRFKDGYESKDYAELVVVGWAGVARPESGIRLLEICPCCHLRRYSGLENAELAIDWSQWSGEDFFVLWPLMDRTLITPRVAELLKLQKVKSYRLASLAMWENRKLPESLRGFTIPRISVCMPEDVARRIGGSSGLD